MWVLQQKLRVLGTFRPKFGGNSSARILQASRSSSSWYLRSFSVSKGAVMKVNNKGLSESGFTLVEIAIVLVIIGLLLGGILKGQEMITQARIKNAINDFNGVVTAITSYQDRYRALPGDDKGATTRWAAQAPAAGANQGDGVIAGAYNANNTGGTNSAPAGTTQSQLFWQHLRLAGFVSGPTVGPRSGPPPPHAAAGLGGVETARTARAARPGFSRLVLCSANL